MAASLRFLILLCSLLHNFTTSQSKNTHPQNKAAVFHVTRDISTLQYVTQIKLGTPSHPTSLIVDLAASSLSLTCSPHSMPSRTFSKSSKCETSPQNRLTQLATLPISQHGYVTKSKSKTESLLFSCLPKSATKGLTAGARGSLGLGRARASMTSQIASSFGSKPQFILCLSSSNGVVLHDTAQFTTTTTTTSFVSSVSDSLTYTPLVTQVDSPHEYVINLKSIKVNGKKLSLNSKEGIGGNGIIKLSTVVAYSTMHSSIYAIFVRAFEQAALAINMTRVPSVAPFGLCFGAESVRGVPVVDLALQSEMVKWILEGRSLMVEVGDGVMCLGVLDGGLEQKASIVLGGHQLENTLLHFDLGASMLGIGSSKSMDGDGCSDLGLSFGFKDSM